MPPAMLDWPPEARLAAIADLVRRAAPPDDAEVAALCACLGDRRKAVQRRAAEALAARATDRVSLGDRLRAALGAPELHERWGAVYAFSLLGSVPLAALTTLLELLGSNDGDLRWAAADLLKQLAQEHRAVVVDPLLGIARAPGPQRKMALYCLRDLGVAEAFDVAVAALIDAAIESRLAALAVIAKVHPSAVTAARHIAALLDDGDARMQRAAAGTLGFLGVGADEIVDALQRAAASEDPSLRRAAARSLRILERRAPERP